MKYFKIIVCILLQFHVVCIYVSSQRTALETYFGSIYRPMRLIGLQAFTRTSHNKVSMQIMKEQGKLQHLSSEDQKKFCDAKNGPGRRNSKKPNSVHRLRPGDIDIVGAIGDSLTAGNGAFAVQPYQVTIENRGVVFAIGGKATWKQYLTIPNILKEFNPKLYGYSSDDGLSTDRHSKFNVGELGAMTHDLPHMARILWKRMKHDSRVNMTNDWKLVTLFSGSNDICIESCYIADKNKFIENHKKNLLRTFRFLRDNIPRLLLYVIVPPYLTFIRKLPDMPEYCNYLLAYECPCIGGAHKTKKDIEIIEDINNKVIEIDKEIANLPEFNTDNFTIAVTDFATFNELPKGMNGKSSLRILSYDCFHLSQLGHALSANALWNNFFEKPNEKSKIGSELFRVFHCPSEDQPYIVTRENMKSDFIK